MFLHIFRKLGKTLVLVGEPFVEEEAKSWQSIDRMTFMGLLSMDILTGGFLSLK